MIITILGLILFIRSLITKQYRYILASCAAFFYGIIWTMRSMPQLIDYAGFFSSLEFVFLLLLVIGLTASSVRKQQLDPVTLILSGAALLVRLIYKIYYRYSVSVLQTIGDPDIITYFSTLHTILNIINLILLLIISATLIRILIRMRKN